MLYVILMHISFFFFLLMTYYLLFILYLNYGNVTQKENSRDFLEFKMLQSSGDNPQCQQHIWARNC